MSLDSQLKPTCANCHFSSSPDDIPLRICSGCQFAHQYCTRECNENHYDHHHQHSANKHGADVSRGGTDGTTPLFAACQGGNEEIVTLLIKNGANVSQGNIDGITPFFVACLNGHMSIVTLLIDQGADVSQGDTGRIFHAVCQGGITPFFVACLNGH